MEHGNIMCRNSIYSACIEVTASPSSTVSFFSQSNFDTVKVQDVPVRCHILVSSGSGVETRLDPLKDVPEVVGACEKVAVILTKCQPYT